MGVVTVRKTRHQRAVKHLDTARRLCDQARYALHSAADENDKAEEHHDKAAAYHEEQRQVAASRRDEIGDALARLDP